MIATLNASAIPAAPVAIREGGEEMEIVQHGEGRGEGADGVFSAGEIDGRFYADAAIALGERGGGDADDAQAAMDERGGEADGIQHRAAAGDNDEGMAVQPEIEHFADEACVAAQSFFAGSPPGTMRGGAARLTFHLRHQAAAPAARPGVAASAPAST